MKLTLDGIKDRQAWEKAGIKLPGYDVEAVSKKAKDAPGWVHFGIGNIFRVFIGGSLLCQHIGKNLSEFRVLLDLCNQSRDIRG